MASKEFAIEYTEDQYSSRSEMSRSLGFQISDMMWKKVTDYRSTFNHPLPLKWFTNKSLVLCVYPTFASRINQIENKMNSLINDAQGLDKENGNFKKCRNSNVLISLKEVAKYKNFQIEDDALNKLIASENPFNRYEDILMNYLSALNFIERSYVNNIDVDFLAALFSELTGNNELTYFYREKNFGNLNSFSVISRVYDSAPFELIPNMMESLFQFLQSSKMGSLEKALITYEYVLDVKPFEFLNEEIAVLLAKAVMAHFSYRENASLLNFEVLLNIKPDIKRKLSNEVQSNCDLTYALTIYLPILESSLSETTSLITKIELKEIKNDFYKTDEKPKEEIKNLVVEEKPIAEQKSEKPITANVAKEATIKKEQPVVEQPVKDNIIAVKFINSSLDEPSAKRLEHQLLETDVFLKKGEAYFYARHCTLGSYYTIEQFKKSVRCVYETARTSMEHLVKLGYYSKQQVGKKFVYTPIERK